MGNEFFGLTAEGHVIIGADRESVCWSHRLVVKVIRAEDHVWQ
jgi:hypothetical protein